MSEQVAFCFRYEDGEERTNIRLVDEWPLPERLEATGGAYVKVSESQLPPGIDHVMRGAVYEWRDEP